MKYKTKTILYALLLAPIPLLVFMALLFILLNSEFKPYSLFMILVGHFLVYLAYCILTVPFSLLLSLGLNHYRCLNFFTICLSALLIAAPLFIVLECSHTGQLPKQWGVLYDDIFAFFIALIPAVCYWLILINLKPNHSVNELDR